MDFGEVLTKAWKIVWKFKILWIFGIFAGCGTNSGGSFNGGGAVFKPVERPGFRLPIYPRVLKTIC